MASGRPPETTALASDAPTELPPDRSERDDTRAWLEAYAAGVGSPLELRFLRLFEGHGLPVEKQVRVAPDAGGTPTSAADLSRGTAVVDAVRALA